MGPGSSGHGAPPWEAGSEEDHGWEPRLSSCTCGGRLTDRSRVIGRGLAGDHSGWTCPQPSALVPVPNTSNFLGSDVASRTGICQVFSLNHQPGTGFRAGWSWMKTPSRTSCITWASDMICGAAFEAVASAPSRPFHPARWCCGTLPLRRMPCQWHPVRI